MPVSFSTLLPNRIRRDEARVRRQGTGRVTTKRTFSLNVFKGSQLGQFGRKTGLPLKQGVKRDAYGLDDVDNFWRDSTHDSLAHKYSKRKRISVPRRHEPSMQRAKPREPNAWRKKVQAPEASWTRPLSRTNLPSQESNQPLRPWPLRRAP